tara:strand:+ start:668 stop:1348 length:681 start_codon:yes stop_codon:yes gene_type:complete
VSTLAHVFEAAGLSTVVLASMRDVVERMHPPRALHCEFPLGRPLGKPADPDFQRDVLMQALALLDVEAPILADHPEVIVADEVPISCPLPARLDDTLAPSVDEARGLRAAYDRSVASRGRTSVGRVLDADGVVDALEVLDHWAGGEAWTEVPLPGKNTIAVAHDIRSYYEEAALELVDGPPPGGRQVEAWFYEETEAGRTLMAARKALREQEAPFPFWFYMAPGHR